MSSSDVHRPSQRLTIRIALTGNPDFSFATHGDGTGGPGSQVTVTSGDYLIYLHDEYAVRSYATAWLSRHAELLADQLPATADPVVAARPATDLQATLAIHATGQERPFVRREGDALAVTIGAVTWQCHDKRAFAGQQYIWRTALKLATVILPAHDWHPRPRR